MQIGKNHKILKFIILLLKDNQCYFILDLHTYFVSTCTHVYTHTHTHTHHWITLYKQPMIFFPFNIPINTHLQHYFRGWFLSLCVSFSHSVVSHSLQPQGLQHTRLPCSTQSPRVHSNSCPLSWWYHPAIASSVVPFLLPSVFPNHLILLGCFKATVNIFGMNQSL